MGIGGYHLIGYRDLDGIHIKSPIKIKSAALFEDPDYILALSRCLQETLANSARTVESDE